MLQKIANCDNRILYILLVEGTVVHVIARVCVRVCVRACVHVCVRACVYACVCAYMCTCMRECTHARTHACICVIFEFCFCLHAENFHLSYTNYSTIYLRIGQMLSIEVSYSPSSPCFLSDLSSLASLPSCMSSLFPLFLSLPFPSSLSSLLSPSSFTYV